MTDYYVSFSHATDGSLGFGAQVIHLPAPINREQIRALVALIEELTDCTDVVPLWWQPLAPAPAEKAGA